MADTKTTEALLAEGSEAFQSIYDRMAPHIEQMARQRREADLSVFGRLPDAPEVKA